MKTVSRTSSQTAAPRGCAMFQIGFCFSNSNSSFRMQLYYPKIYISFISSEEIVGKTERPQLNSIHQEPHKKPIASFLDYGVLKQS